MQSYVCGKEQTDPGVVFVIAVLGVGRVIALFNWLCMKKNSERANINQREYVTK